MKQTLSRPIIIAIGWTLLVIVSLTLPGSSVPQADILEYDKAVHALLFGVGVFLWLRVRWSWGPARLVIVFGALAFAPVSELIQAVLGRGRSADPWDAAADVVGVLLGLGAWLIRRRMRGTDPSTVDASRAQSP